MLSSLRLHGEPRDIDDRREELPRIGPDVDVAASQLLLRSLCERDSNQRVGAKVDVSEERDAARASRKYLSQR